MIPRLRVLTQCRPVCCVLERDTLLLLAPLDPEMGTDLGWEGNRHVVQRTGDPLTATL